MLFSSFSVGGLELKNRIVMPPMCMYSAGRDGKANDWHFTHYAARATGQVGLIIVEATGIEDRGRISADDLGIWDDSQADGLKRIVELVKQNGARIAIQLNHAGRKSQVEYLEPVGPSALRFSEDFRQPRALTVDEIQTIVDRFAKAAKRAVAAGFEAIEIHGAHGYLLNQFLSPLSNQREDEYGGPPANRVRLLGEVVEAVRSAIPANVPLIVRVSAADYEAGGNTPEIMGDMLNMVKHKGIDLVDVSSGAVTPAMPRAYPSYQIPYALIVKEKTNLPVIGGGLVTEPIQAEQILKSGVDLVFIGRELLRNPYWPLKAAFVLGQGIDWPKPYARGKYL